MRRFTDEHRTLVSTRFWGYLVHMLYRNERLALQRHEKVIECARRYRLLEAQALKAIRTGRLYRANHDTFEDYCKHRWGFTRIQGHRLCAWAEVADNLLPIGITPTRESHARPLTALTPDQQRRAWTLYISKQPVIHKARHIERICRAVQRSPVNSGALSVPPADTAKRSGEESVVSPVTWFGSKAKLSTRIVNLLPPHVRFIDAFAGSAALLFRKQPAKIEIINDLDGDIVNLFRVLRDRGRAKELQRLLRLTPYARDEHEWCKDNPDCDEPVENARRFVVRCRQSYAGIVDDSWSLAFSKNRASDFSNPVDQIEAITKRLRNVQVENTDFRKLLPKSDLANTAIFCDPPYLPSVRSGNPQKLGQKYRHEMSADDHADLLGIVTAFTQSKVMLCGYRSRLYDQHLRGWRRYEFQTGVRASNVSAGTDRTTKRTEVVWTNF